MSPPLTATMVSAVVQLSNTEGATQADRSSSFKTRLIVQTTITSTTTIEPASTANLRPISYHPKFALRADGSYD